MTGFNYKSPDAYKKLLKDKKILKRVLALALVLAALVNVKNIIFRPKPACIPPRPIQTSLIIQKDVPVYAESFATLSPLLDVDIKSQVTGRIKEVHFKNGDYVKQGDKLYTIDPSEYEAGLAKARACLEQSEADLKLKTDTLERNKKLVEKELISKQDFETLQAQLLSAQGQVDLDKASLELAAINLGYCHIVSPVSGVTAKNQLDPGNIVVADNGPVLVNIKDIDALFADFTLPERELFRVRESMARGALKVEIVPEGGKSVFEGELVFINNAVDNTTGTIYARALIDNKTHQLWAGQFTTIRLILSVSKNAVLAPYSAIKIGQKGHYLFIFDESNKAELRLVKTGLRQDDYIVIEEGARPGEKAIISGILGLYPGAPVVEADGKDKEKESR
ncbi:MAG: efflux RND transporter periplasmic adaptor subunit [Candidatus Omnitrophica bacterium]|jgi:multidrug efflux system membrane fusion protein|nr:efflux RND transporter periplasmic adaptor subunit [Candidatus Omnitrophota bacterium]